MKLRCLRLFRMFEIVKSGGTRQAESPASPQGAGLFRQLREGCLSKASERNDSTPGKPESNKSRPRADFQREAVFKRGESSLILIASIFPVSQIRKNGEISKVSTRKCSHGG